MGKIPEAQNRMFKNTFVCRKCKGKVKAEPRKIVDGKIVCRKCKSTAFRPLRKK